MAAQIAMASTGIDGIDGRLVSESDSPLNQLDGAQRLAIRRAKEREALHQTTESTRILADQLRNRLSSPSEHAVELHSFSSCSSSDSESSRNKSDSGASGSAEGTDGESDNPDSDALRRETFYNVAKERAKQDEPLVEPLAEPPAPSRTLPTDDSFVHRRLPPATVMYSILDGRSDDLSTIPWAMRAATVYTLLIVLCILWSIVSFLYETQPTNWGKDDVTFFGLEVAVVVVFTIDYVARLLLTPDPRFALPPALRCSCLPSSLGGGGHAVNDTSNQTSDLPTGFVWVFLNIIDFVSVVPFYVELIVAAAANGSSQLTSLFTILRILRLFRLARVLKAAKYVALLQLVGQTMAKSLSGFVLLIFSVLCAGLLFGAVQFYAENLTACQFSAADQTWYYVDATGALGDPSPYQSVLDGAWWAIITLTTVGYGDKFPVSWLGQSVAVLCVLCGLVVLAFPITIISQNFAELTALQNKNELRQYSHQLADDSMHTNRQLLAVCLYELDMQAASINELQAALDAAGQRWRVIEAAARIVNNRLVGQRLQRRTDVDVGFNSTRQRAK